MGTLAVFGFLKGFQPIAGFSYGAKNFRRLREAIRTSILWSTIFCIIVGLLMFLFSEQIIAQFANGNEAMILVGKNLSWQMDYPFSYLDFIQYILHCF